MKRVRQELPIVFALAWPIIVGQVGQMLYGMIDVVMVGRLGTTDLAATAFANSVFVVFFVFGIGIANSVSPLISRSLGRDDLKSAGQIFRHSVMVTAASGLILTILCLCMLFLFSSMGQLPEVVVKARAFFAVISLTLIPALLFQCFKQVLESLGHPKIPMFVMLFGVLCNVLLNRVLIFGWGYLPALGITGAALGTLLSRLIALGIVFLFVRQAERTAELREHAWAKHLPKTYHWSLVRELLDLGVPSGFSLVFEVGAFASAAVMMGWIGSVELASHQIALSMCSLTFMVPMGLSFAASIRVGYASGRHDYEAARDSGLAAMVMAALFMGASGLVYAVGNHWLPRLFSNDHAVQLGASKLLLVAALFQLFDGIQVVGTGLLRALKDVRLPFTVTLLAYWAIALPCGYLLAFSLKLGPVGIWYGLFIGLLIASIALTARFFKLVSSLAQGQA